MAFYESIYIIRPDLTTEQIEQVNRRVTDHIAALGGKVLRTELWGRRQLAYIVRKNSNGFYVFHSVEGAGNMVRELEARLAIDEDILKYLNVRVEKANSNPTPLGRPEEKREGSPRLEEGEVFEGEDMAEEEE
ncbi:MAG: 30S ribosomal protein S6 [Magnetococcales bacterium]|nr:30S ribosomal protein S6 [Magnetococcales bacterium]